MSLTIIAEKLLAVRVNPEAATRGVLQEKVFLEISQSQQNTCARVFLFLSNPKFTMSLTPNFSISKSVIPYFY